MNRYHIPKEELAHMERSRIPFAIYQFVDKRVVTLALSAGFRDLFGYEDKAQAYYDMDNDMYKDTHIDDAARIADAAFRFATEGGKYDVIYRTKNHRDGGYRIIHAQGEHFKTETGEQLAQVWYTDEGSFNENDTEIETFFNRSLKNALFEESYIKASYYDHLTGLPSMTYFFELAEITRNDMIEKGGDPAMLFMDFSGMKYFNHKYGFNEGDKLLQAFSRLLAAHFGNENCSRLGQDHFAVIADTNGLEDQLRKIFKECETLNDGNSLPVHVGIFKDWYDGVVVSMACDRAKFACDKLKSVFSSELSYYSTSMKNAEDIQQYIIANLDKAIAERWIKVYYQPIVRAVNGRVCEEEALARWIDPMKGFMSPGEFIPVLEEHKLIYKLDLYVVESVLNKIDILTKAGLDIMPQSVNLSRSDFDSCDIVEEICRRVDAAGISRSMLTIEITESVIGKDFEFMKAEIDRFREHGFAVWMDDFGSGYSSLDVLQSIKFDLIKFDMRFMQQFNEGDSGKIILTELLKMATSLGIDTVCEGVETREQAQFLQETGCSKLQGYLYEKPIPVEQILAKYAKGVQIGFENPDEMDYYESIGRVNLHDLSIIAQEDINEFGNVFNTLPMAVIEINDGQVRFTRTNQTYRDFMERCFTFEVNDKPGSFHDQPEKIASPFMNALQQSCYDDSTLFLEEKMPDGAIVNSCLRRIAINPCTGTVAVAVAVLAVREADNGTNFVSIAKALAADYFNLYYVDIETEKFFEYSSKAGENELAMERSGENFFFASRRDALELLYFDDRKEFVKAFTKENVLRQIDEQGNFTHNYRLIMNGKPVYVSMKAMRMQDDPGHIIIGVRNVDIQMRQQKILEKVRQNEMVFSRIIALSGDYICLYTVDPETENYIEYSAVDEYKGFGLANRGTDFFNQSHKDSGQVLYPDDRQMFRENFTKEKVMNELQRSGLYTLDYRVVIGGQPVPVTLRGAQVHEDDGEKLIIGVYKPGLTSHTQI